MATALKASPKPVFERRRRQSERWSVYGSLFLHAVGAGLLSAAYLLDLLPVAPVTGTLFPAGPGPGVEMVEVPEGLPLDEAATRRLIAEELKRINELAPDEREREYERAVQRLSKVSRRSVEEIAGFLGVEDGCYTPRAKAPAGRFLYDRCTIDAIERIRNAEGLPGYRVTLVDVEGRTLDYEVWGTQARIYDNHYRILQRAKEGGIFGLFYNRIAKPVLAEMAQKAYEKKVGKGTAAGERKRKGATSP